MERIDKFEHFSTKNIAFDPMIEAIYTDLTQKLFTQNTQPEPILSVDNIAAYSQQEGLSLSAVAVGYLESVAKEINIKLTDSEVFGFPQVNSEHCRHKIFNGTFEIDGKQMPKSLFQLIKKQLKKIQIPYVLLTKIMWHWFCQKRRRTKSPSKSRR